MSWLLYNRCAWAHKTCETVNKSSKSDICYIDSDAIEISLSRFAPLALKAFSACLPVQAAFENHEIACHNSIS